MQQHNGLVDLRPNPSVRTGNIGTGLGEVVCAKPLNSQHRNDIQDGVGNFLSFVHQWCFYSKRQINEKAGSNMNRLTIQHKLYMQQQTLLV